MLAPVANEFSLPVIITTLTVGSFSSSTKTYCNYSIKGLVKKISLVGGSITTVATESLMLTEIIEGLKWAFTAANLCSTILIIITFNVY